MTGVAPTVARPQWPVPVAAALFAVTTLVFTSAFASFLRLEDSSDLTVHLAYAAQLQSLADLQAPHFLFQLLVIAGHWTGLSYGTAAAWLLGLCYGGMALLIWSEMQRREVGVDSFRAFVLVLAVLLSSHIFLLTFGSNLYRGYFVPTAYHNPTQQLNKLFGLWIVVLYAREFLGTRPVRSWTVPLFAVLCVLSALAKPSFLIAFLPVAALYAVVDLTRGGWRRALLCLAGIGIPSAVTLLFQARLTGGLSGEAVGLAFRPFALFDATETLYKLPMSLAFPLVVLAGAWWTRSADATLRFIWAFTTVALFFTLCIVEPGQRMAHGNLAWTGQTGVFLGYVESLLFLLTQRGRLWTRLAWVVFAVHVGCGLYWYTFPYRSSWAGIF
jgi:hypothetical protein